jgi:hypothetical protein
VLTLCSERLELPGRDPQIYTLVWLDSVFWSPQHYSCLALLVKQWTSIHKVASSHTRSYMKLTQRWQSSSSFYPPKSQNWALLAGIRQDTLCMLVSVCFHNLVTYAQRLQDLYSACLMFWMRTHTGPRFIVSSEGRESHQPQVNLGVSYELQNSCPWRAANPEPFALESDALPLRHWLSLLPHLVRWLVH